MKTIDLKHKCSITANRELAKHGVKCKLDAYKDVYFVECVCKGDKEHHQKEIRKDIIDDIDTNGNGRITKKEIKAFIKKNEDK